MLTLTAIRNVCAAATMVAALQVVTVSPAAAQDLRDEVNAAPLDRSLVSARTGYRPDAPFNPYVVDAGGRVTIYGEEIDLFDVRLAQDPRPEYTGYSRSGDELGPLPIGSRLDAATGVFTWQAGVGFLHAYDLVFVRWDNGRAAARQEVRFVIGPKATNLSGAQVVIETPSTGADVSQPFVLTGWAVDQDASAGTGIATLHVWAYPAAGGPAQWVGVASVGGERPDVGAVLGERFRNSGYGLVVNNLAPGSYDIAVFAWSTATGGFVPAKVVRVNVR
jgi:hypothetical protein